MLLLRDLPLATTCRLWREATWMMLSDMLPIVDDMPLLLNKMLIVAATVLLLLLAQPHDTSGTGLQSMLSTIRYNGGRTC